MPYQKKGEMIMEIELMTKQESYSVKGGQWIYWEGEWYWVEETR